MKMLLAPLAFLVISMISPVARADEAADKAQLTELEKQSSAALVSGDYQVLGSIFAEDWILVGPAGELMSRQMIFEQMRNGELKFSAYVLDQMEIRIFGDTAVIVGRAEPKGEWKGQKFADKEVFSDTFIRVGGKWHCVASHSSVLDEEK